MGWGLMMMVDAVALDDAAMIERVNELLVMWHGWCAGHVYAPGFSSVCSTFRLARASRQYDDVNGSLDAQVDVGLAEAVDAQIDAMEQPFRSALAVLARNLHAGVSVWSSPLLPRCPVARGQVLMAARKKFVERLDRAGLL